MTARPCETSFNVSLEPHASVALFVTGKRIEKSVYQAEESFLNMFSTIEGYDSPVYLPNESAEMGMYAAGLGCNPDNWLQWNNVFSCKGGEYVMTVRYASAASTGFTVSVNGKKAGAFEDLSTGDDSSAWDTVNVKLKLKKGLNQIRLSNDSGFMPSIDCMALHRAER